MATDGMNLSRLAHFRTPEHPWREAARELNEGVIAEQEDILLAYMIGGISIDCLRIRYQQEDYFSEQYM